MVTIAHAEIEERILQNTLDAYGSHAYFSSPDGQRFYAFGEVTRWTPDKGNVANWWQQLTTSAPDTWAVGGMDFGGSAIGTQWFVPEWVFIQDNQQWQVVYQGNKSSLDWRSVLQYQESTDAEQSITIQQQSDEIDWQQRVQQVIETYLQPNLAQKIVLARQRHITLNQAPTTARIIATLQTLQPNNYQIVITMDNQTFVTATPERLVKVQQDELLTAGLAGTTNRGATTQIDEQLGQTLLNDAKNRAEHDLVVQRIVQELRPVTTQLNVPQAPILLKNTQVQHLYTPITGKLAAGMHALSVAQRLHPTPALGGEPRELALQVIQETERHARGWFGAPVGYLHGQQDGELTVGIRSMRIADKQATLFAGAGILTDSNPASEYHETDLKFQPMMTLLEALS